MKHHHFSLFDTDLRRAWYSNAPFPLAAALLTSSGIRMRQLPCVKHKRK
jgi:hypothetical protein